MCPYLDGRAPIAAITHAQGTLTTGYIQAGNQIVSQDCFYHWIEHGKFRIWTTYDQELFLQAFNASTFDDTISVPAISDRADRAPRSRWQAPTGPITRNTQVTEKPFALIPGGYKQSSLVSEQEKNSLIPDEYENLNKGSKDWIQKHGKVRYPTPDGYNATSNYSFGDIFSVWNNAGNKGFMNEYEGAYGGTTVVTNTYIKDGKENAFKENRDDLTYTAIDLHKHPARDMKYGGATLAGMKSRGLIK